MDKLTLNRLLNGRRGEIIDRLAEGKLVRTNMFGIIPIWRYPTKLERKLAQYVQDVKGAIY